eukprot:773571-Prymnesium_polylepis.1
MEATWASDTAVTSDRIVEDILRWPAALAAIIAAKGAKVPELDNRQGRRTDAPAHTRIRAGTDRIRRDAPQRESAPRGQHGCLHGAGARQLVGCGRARGGEGVPEGPGAQSRCFLALWTRGDRFYGYRAREVPSTWSAARDATRVRLSADGIHAREARLASLPCAVHWTELCIQLKSTAHCESCTVYRVPPLAVLSDCEEHL